MRLSNALFVTQRETPSDAELTSHQLLLRAGFIRRVGSGTYAYLPFMQRVLRKLHDIIHEELAATGAQECLLPQLQGADLWRESGRWDAYTQAEGIMFALTDRQGREQVLGPTHEEVVTFLARDMIRSYRQLPVHLYQIQTKFRDEIRPRFGLLRAREFTMKDGYSFHATPEDLRVTFEQVGEAYERILNRVGVQWRAVQADSGAIGGSNSREFMVLAQAGEDEVLYTDDGLYAANVEKAESRLSKARPSPFQAFEKRETPNATTIECACRLLGCHASNMVKNVLYEAHLNGVMVPVLVSLRGDQTVNETKLANVITEAARAFGADTLLRLAVPSAEQQRVWLKRDLPLNYLAPDLSDELIADVPGVAAHFLRIVDRSAAELTNFVTGANEHEVHVVGANWREEFALPASVVDVRLAKEGDASLHDASQVLRSARGIEVGHTFELGTKYASAMRATFADTEGQERCLWMGCYGMGVTRLVQAVAEQHHDSRGLVWPLSIAPFQVHLVVPNMRDALQVQVAERLYAELVSAGVDVLLDDRDERAGVKLNDADLLGVPVRVVTGRLVAGGEVEWVERTSGHAASVRIEGLVTRVLEFLGGMSSARYVPQRYVPQAEHHL